MSKKSNIKMKFCEALDRFVEIREFSEEEINKLFKNIKVTDKRSYKRLIINAAVVNYLDEIAPLIFGDNNYSLFGEIAEQELYNLCISINPSLDIKKVTITIDEDADSSAIPYLSSGGNDIEDEITDKLINMEEYLKKRIVGQDEAIKVLAQALRRAHVGLRNPNRPIGTFLFAGQTGVGKTELAKALAEFLNGDENELIRIDCSEYSASHEYAKLIGAPPGYVGHKDGGILTEAVKQKPRSVVLFDEVEKADEKVHNLLLQIFDAGILTDNKGNKISFKNTVIIMTCNVGVKEVKAQESRIGFGDHKKEITHEFKTRAMLKALQKTFRPEFLNRIDEVINFRALTKEDNLKIVDILLKEVKERLANPKLNMSLIVDKKTKEFLVEKGWDVKNGARPLKRAIWRYIESPLSDLILQKKFTKGDKIKTVVDKKKDVITFKKATKKATKSKSKIRKTNKPKNKK